MTVMVALLFSIQSDNPFFTQFYDFICTSFVYQALHTLTQGFIRNGLKKGSSNGSKNFEFLRTILNESKCNLSFFARIHKDIPQRTDATKAYSTHLNNAFYEKA